jgi:DNA-directed RNA polymerase sigma subunit (sigma70/sigma32)
MGRRRAKLPDADRILIPEFINRLSRLQRYVVIACHTTENPSSLKDVARALGGSVSRVEWIRQKAIKKLREMAGDVSFAVAAVHDEERGF